MDQITRVEILHYLRLLNSGAPEHDLVVYADSWLSYKVAAKNLADNGDIVSHPRTGSPMENPYLQIRTKMGDTLRKISIDSGNLLKYDSFFRLSVCDDPDDPDDEDVFCVPAQTAQEAADSVATFFNGEFWIKFSDGRLPPIRYGAE